jgi:protein ImuB
MNFACIFVPDFAVEAVVRAEPELRAQAVAVVDGTPPLLYVIAVNDAARQAGIAMGMTKLQAEGRRPRAETAGDSCPGLAVRRRSALQEAAAHAALVDCACSFSPRVEAAPARPDVVVLDISGLERLFGPAPEIARKLAQRAAELGLQANIAIATNIEAASCAARGFSGITVIPRGDEANRLGPLPVEALLSTNLSSPDWEESRLQNNATIARILDTLDRWGIRTLRAFAALPETAVQERLGEAGVRLQKLARGEGSRPLVPSELPLVFQEAAELEYPLALREPLAFLLNRMLEQLCARLSARALATQELTLRLALTPGHGENPPQRHRDAEIVNSRFSNCDLAPDRNPADGRAQIKIQNSQLERDRSAADDRKQHQLVLRLPVPMLDAKTLLKLLQLELRTKPPSAPVEKVFLSAEPVRPRCAQGGLYLPATFQPEKLALTMARLEAVVGCRVPNPASGSETGAAVVDGGTEPRAGSPELLDTHYPDAFRMKKFAPPVAGDPQPRSGAAQSAGRARSEIPTAAERQHLALRRFRPPVPAQVKVRAGRPVSFNAQTASSQPAAGECFWVSGPWRESGQWWTGAPWARETWDVAVRNDHTTVFYRLYRDTMQNKWFLEAVYD